MSFSHWLRTLTSLTQAIRPTRRWYSQNRSGRRCRNSRLQYKPELLQLEDRCLLSTYLDPFMPSSTLPNLSDLLFTGNALVGDVPAKPFTIYNNADQTIYPFLYDANNGKSGASWYDPLDKHGEEYRLYVGYTNNGQNYLGLKAHTSLTVNVPYVFWDSGRMAVATDGHNLLPKNPDGTVNLNTNKNTPNVENPFHFEFYNLDLTQTQRVVVTGVNVTDLTTNQTTPTGALLYYHSSDNPGEDPGLDNPDQLIEYTIRDKEFMTKISDNYGAINPAQLVTLVNYDVSYVDHLLLPVAMAGFQVPIVETVGNTVLAQRDFGWIGASNSYLGTTTSLQSSLETFIKNNPDANTNVNGLGTYFDGRGWPSFFNPNYSPTNKNPGIRIPGGANIFLLSPLGDSRSSFSQPYGPINHWMLSSGGDQPIHFDDGGILGADRQTITLGAGSFLNYLKTGTWTVTTGNLPGVIAGTVDPNSVDTVNKTVRLTAPAPSDFNPGLPGYSFIFSTPVTDPYADRIRAIWYSWANYYAGLFNSFAPTTIPAIVTADGDSSSDTRILTFSTPHPELKMGMQVSGGTIPSDTLITILKISADQKTVYLSRPVPGVTSGSNVNLTFAKPPLIATFGDTITGTFTIDPTKFGDFPGGLEGANQFAGNVYEVLSVFSTIYPRLVPKLPPSMELLANSIGGNVGFLPTAAFTNITADIRDVLKSALRGVPNFADPKYPESLWYPNPSTPTGGQTYNIFNLDPYVWFVHKQAGLSGYGFSFDDDASDVGAEGTGSLSIAVGGLTGLTNKKEWFPSTYWGSVSSQATIRIGTAADGAQYDGKSLLQVLDPIVFWQVKPTDLLNALNGAYVSSSTGNLNPGTQIVAFGPDLAKHEFVLSGHPPATTTAFIATFNGKNEKGSNVPPSLEAIADQTGNRTQTAGTTITLKGGDAEGDSLTYTANAYFYSYLPAFQLKQDLGLFFSKSYYENYHGLYEKWMAGNNGQWYCILANGQLRRWGGTAAATMLPANLIATLPTYFYNDPSLLWKAQPPSTHQAYQIDRSLGLSFANSYYENYHGMGEKWMKNSSGQWYCILANGQLRRWAGNTPDTLLPANLIATLPTYFHTYPQLLWNASVPSTHQAYQLDQSLGLSFANSYYENAHGMGEKWMKNSSGQWYCILANGELRRWAGNTPDTLLPANLIATLPTYFHTDPSLLWNAHDLMGLTGYVNVVGNQLTLAPPANFVGTFIVEASASDVLGSSTRTFQVTVTDNAPTLAAIADRSGTYAQINGQTINLVGYDPDGDSLTYSAAAYTASVQAYQLDQRLGLYYPGSYYQNAWGMGEKWMQGNGGAWYCILANGEVRRWGGSAAATLQTENLIAILNTSFYTDPSLLWNAAVPTQLAGYVSLVGNVLTLTPPLGFVGTFVVEVTVSDGALSYKRIFRVTVTG